MSQKPSLNAFLLSFIPLLLLFHLEKILMLLAKDVKLNWLVGASHFDEMKCIKTDLQQHRPGFLYIFAVKISSATLSAERNQFKIGSHRGDFLKLFLPSSRLFQFSVCSILICDFTSRATWPVRILCDRLAERKTININRRWGGGEGSDAHISAINIIH